MTKLNHCPGDVVIINDIVFPDGKVDTRKEGRPCIVLYSKKIDNEEYIYFLITTINPCALIFYNEDHRYLPYPNNSKYFPAVDTAVIYTIKDNDSIKTIRNVEKSYFPIINNVIALNQSNLNDQTATVVTTLKKLTYALNPADLVSRNNEIHAQKLAEKDETKPQKDGKVHIEDLLDRKELAAFKHKLQKLQSQAVLGTAPYKRPAKSLTRTLVMTTEVN